MGKFLPSPAHSQKTPFPTPLIAILRALKARLTPCRYGDAETEIGVSGQALGNIVSREMSADIAGKIELRADLDKIADQVAKSPWKADSAVLASLGEAWAEAGEFDKAITSYSAALKSRDATIQVRAVEQLGNLEVRQGARLIDQAAKLAELISPELEKQSQALIASGKRRIEALLELEATGERLALRAKTYKIAATPNLSANDFLKALKEMQSAYWAAADYKRQKNESDLYYPLTNWLDATILLGEAAGESKQQFVEALSQALESAKKEAKEKASFWNRVAQPDLLLRQYLADGTLEQNLSDLIREYTEVIHFVGTAKDQDSVFNGISFLEQSLRKLQRDDEAEKLKHLAETLKQKLG